MAKDKKKEYSSIIDAFLEDRKPDWKELGLKDAVKSGEEQLHRTHDYIDGDVLEEISESVESHHTMGPRGGKGGQKKLVGSAPEDWARHSHNAINEDTVLGDALHDIETKIHSNETGLKKALSDEDVLNRIDKILGSGLSAAQKTAFLKKLGEIQLFNKGMATDYLNRTAPQLGINYLEPNTYMDKESPAYEREDVNLASEEDPFGDITPLTPVGPTEAEDANGDIKTAIKTPQVPALKGMTPLGIPEQAPPCKSCGKPLGEDQLRIRRCYTPGCAEENMTQENRPHKASKGSGPAILASYGYKKAGVIVTREPQGYPGQENCIKCQQPTRFWYNEGEEPLCEKCAPSTSPEDVARLVGGKRASSATVYFHESGASIKTSNLGWSYRAKGGVEQNSGTSVKALIAYLDKVHARQAPIEAGQRSTEVSIMSSKTENGMRRNVEQKFAHTLSQVAAQTIQEFDSGDVEKFRKAGQSLSHIHRFAEAKVGAVGASKAINEWLRGKKQESNKLVLASEDVTFLRDKMGYRIPSQTESRSAGVSTINRELKKQAAPVKQATFEFTAGSVEKLHAAKYTLAQIYSYAEKKFGSGTATESIKGWLRSRKQSGVIPVLVASDKEVLQKLGFKPFREVGEVSTSVHKASRTSPVDGHAMMNEFDLTKRTAAADIDTDGTKFEDVELGGTFRIDF